MHQRKLDEGVHNGCGVLGADEDVDVLDGLTAAPQRAAHFQALDAGAFAKLGDNLVSEQQGLIETDTVAELVQKGDAFENLVLRLGAEAFELGHRPGGA